MVCGRRQRASGTEVRSGPATCWLCGLGESLPFLSFLFFLCVMQMTKISTFQGCYENENWYLIGVAHRVQEMVTTITGSPEV